jgi:hypothetical protein
LVIADLEYCGDETEEALVGKVDFMAALTEIKCMQARLELQLGAEDKN